MEEYNKMIEDASHIYRKFGEELGKGTVIKPTPEALASLTATVLINHEKNQRVKDMKAEREPKSIDKEKLLKELDEKMKQYPNVEIDHSPNCILVRRNGKGMDEKLFNQYKNDLKNMGFLWNKQGYWELEIE